MFVFDVSVGTEIYLEGALIDSDNASHKLKIKGQI